MQCEPDLGGSTGLDPGTAPTQAPAYLGAHVMEGPAHTRLRHLLDESTERAATPTTKAPSAARLFFSGLQPVAAYGAAVTSLSPALVALCTAAPQTTTWRAMMWRTCFGFGEPCEGSNGPYAYANDRVFRGLDRAARYFGK